MSRLGRALGFFVTILTLPTAAAAQFPPGPPPLARGSAVIVGQVVDAATGKGISSAIVTLAGSSRAMTTSDGRFAFRALPSGSHSLSATKSGYIGGAYGMRRPDSATLPVVLADGERRGDIVIWMWRQGSISGSIVDEAGEPVVGIQVTALRRMTLGGRRRFAQSGVGTTDDRGVYRLSRLAPGDYAVGMIASQVSVPAATVRQFEETAMSGGDLNRNAVFQAMMQVGAPPLMSGTESRQVGDQVQTIGRGAPVPPPIDGAKLFAYPSLYYPAALSLASAAVVTVGSGQERTGIDLQVRPVAMVKVSGTVIGGSTPAATLPVRLIPQGSDDSGRSANVGGTVTDAGGAFSFLAAPAGDYVIKILQVPRPAMPATAPTTIAVGTSMMMTESFAPNAELPSPPTEPTLWALLPIAVGDADVAGMNVLLRTGVRVSGRVEFEGTAEKPSRDLLARIPVLVEPLDGPLDRVDTLVRVDAKREFSTPGLAAGRYYIRIGAPPTGWTFKCAFLGERDVSDEPFSGANISAMRNAFVGSGQRSLIPAASAVSDDRGQYRLWGLAAGDYVISANAGFAAQTRDNDIARLTDADVKRAMSEVAAGSARPGGPSDASADPEVRPRTVGYAAVFYPGTPVAAQAIPIKLGAAEERTGVDFPMALVQTARVEGSMVVLEGVNPQSMSAQLISSAPQGFTFDMFRRSAPAKDGYFWFAGVPPGPYAVLAQAQPPMKPAGPSVAPPGPPRPSHWARADIVVDGLDIADVSLVLQPGLTIAGRIQFEGTSAPPPDLSRIRINMFPVQAQGEVSLGQAQIQPDTTGSFTIHGLTPGRYRLTAIIPSARPDANPWQLKSSVLQGRDTVDTPIDLRDSASDAVITFTDRVSELSGLVQDADGQPAPEYHIVLFARDKAYWTPTSRRIRTVRPGADGKYVFANLPPGDYLMTAVTDMEQGEQFDPAFLDLLSRSAIVVAIAEGEKKTQDLRLNRQLP